ncbi:MAG: zinc ribbon domain-containing protein [Nitrosomonas sp.]|nr:zinc ribbon domain-containing protein [Nitrosomonas sp.]
MPIYEYLCNSCGVRKEHIQKMSDTPIKACPECGSAEYAKLISAAGFQLKGSGWYVTDFKNKPAPVAAKSEKSDAQAQSPESKTDSKAVSESNSKTDATPSMAKPNETKTSVTTPAAAD